MNNLNVRICIPWCADHGHRDRLWAYCHQRWIDLDLGWPIITGTNNDDPLNRSRARNAAAAGDWDVAVFSDADNLPHTAEQVIAAVGFAATGQCQVFAHDVRCGLDEHATEEVLAGRRALTPDLAVEVDSNTYSGVWAIGRRIWDDVHGFDERFIGWGFEDLCFMYAAAALSGRTERVPGHLFHLWHPRLRALQEEGPTYKANEALWRRYLDASGNRARMLQIIDEPR